MDWDYQDPLAKYKNNGAPSNHHYDYDLFLIGGGSGGISTARHSA